MGSPQHPHPAARGHLVAPLPGRGTSFPLHPSPSLQPWVRAAAAWGVPRLVGTRQPCRPPAALGAVIPTCWWQPSQQSWARADLGVLASRGRTGLGDLSLLKLFEEHHAATGLQSSGGRIAAEMARPCRNGLSHCSRPPCAGVVPWDGSGRSGALIRLKTAPQNHSGFPLLVVLQAKSRELTWGSLVILCVSPWPRREGRGADPCGGGKVALSLPSQDLPHPKRAPTRGASCCGVGRKRPKPPGSASAGLVTLVLWLCVGGAPLGPKTSVWWAQR